MAYWAVPYFTHNYIDIPDLEQHINVSVAQLHALEASDIIDPDEPDQQNKELPELGNKAEAQDWGEPDIEDE